MTDQKRLYLFPLLALAALLPVLSACTNEPIFSTIESEIPLRDPTLEGKVPSLVQFQGYLYACNGRLKRKQGTAAPGSWQEVARPENRRCAALAATDSTLYGLFQNGAWQDGKIYSSTDGVSWSASPLSGGPDTVNRLFPTEGGFYTVTYEGTGTEQNPASSYTIYKYDGSWTELNSEALNGNVPLGISGSYLVTKEHPYRINGTTIERMPDEEGISNSDSGGKKFLPGGERDIVGMCVSKLNGTAEHLYVLTDDNAWHYNGSEWTRHGIGDGNYDGFGRPEVFVPAGKSPLLLMPLELGYREAPVDSGNGDLTGSNRPGSSTASSVQPEDASQYRSSIDDYPVDFLYTVTDRAYLPSGCEYAVYASVGHYKYGGLWGYYYPGAYAEWNRE